MFNYYQKFLVVLCLSFFSSVYTMKRKEFFDTDIADTIKNEFKNIIDILKKDNKLLQTDEKELQLFLKDETNPNLTIGREKTPLIYLAVLHQKIRLFNYLLKLGADINACDGYGDRALFASMKFHTAIYPLRIEELLQNNASVNMENGPGLTPLCWAAKQGFLQAIQPLIKYKADVNYKSKKNTPLAHAIINDTCTTIKILCNAEASPIEVDNCNNTVFHLAANRTERVIETLIAHISFKQDKQLTDKIKTMLLIFNRFNNDRKKNDLPEIPHDIQFYIFSKVPEYYWHTGLYKHLKNYESKPKVLYLMDSHIEYLTDILKIKNNHGQTALQRIPEWQHSRYSPLLTGSKLQNDLKNLNNVYPDIKVIPGYNFLFENNELFPDIISIPETNLALQILKNHYYTYLPDQKNEQKNI